MNGANQPLDNGLGPGISPVRNPLKEPFGCSFPNCKIGEFHACKPWMVMVCDQVMIVETED